MSGELVPARTSGPAASIIRAGRRGFEYLGKNGDQGVGVMIRLLALLFGAGLVWYNIDAIYHFVDTAVKTGTALIKGGFVAAALFVLWKFLSNRRLHYTVAQMIDQSVEGLHLWWINRDKFGAAQFSIRRLRSRIEVAQNAKGVIEGVIAKQDSVIKKHKGVAEEALQGARGLEREIERRKTGDGRPAGPDVAKLNPAQLEQSFQLARGKLRTHYGFYTRVLEDRARLGQQAEKIAIIIDAIEARVEKLGTDLEIAHEQWELSKQNLIAVQAAADVIGGPEHLDFQRALTGIRDEAFAFDGQVRRYMDQLDPTVKAYRTDRAAADIADDEFYRDFASNLGVDETSVRTKLQAALPPAAPLLEIEAVLGQKPAPAPSVPVLVRSSGGRNVDDLIGRRRR